jgi:hypothetical protein
MATGPEDRARASARWRLALPAIQVRIERGQVEIHTV